MDIHKITIKKSNKTIINDVTFSLPKGRVTAVVGTNGAGKSTLLEAITGGNNAYSGNIILGDNEIRSYSLKELAQRRAVLSQQVSVTFPMLVSELVEMGIYASQELYSQNEMKQFVLQSLEEVGMLDYAGRNFLTLSGGEQKRVLLAKVLLQLNCTTWENDCKYLFLDEPTENLDIQQQFNLLDIITKIALEKNVAVFTILHDINLAAQCADFILMMKQGRIFHHGTPQEVYTSNNIREVFGVESLVQRHPVFECPFVITLPDNTRESEYFLAKSA
jgi:iron complex transport system ATP-binding protein